MSSPRERHDNKSSDLIKYGLAIGAAIFIVIILVIQIARKFDGPIGGTLIAMIILLVGSLGAGFGVSYWLFTQPVSFTCPHCKSHQSNTHEPWICRCGEAYPRSEEEPKNFINTICRNCGRLPQTLQCPLCEKGIPLGDLPNEDSRLWIKLSAFEYDVDRPEPTRREKYRDKYDELLDKENVYQQLLRAIQAENDVDEFKKDRANRNRTPKEQIRASFDELLETKISLHEVEKEMVKTVMENVTDPVQRELLLRNIKAIREDLEERRGYDLDI